MWYFPYESQFSVHVHWYFRYRPQRATYYFILEPVNVSRYEPNEFSISMTSSQWCVKAPLIHNLIILFYFIRPPTNLLRVTSNSCSLQMPVTHQPWAVGKPSMLPMFTTSNSTCMATHSNVPSFMGLASLPELAIHGHPPNTPRIGVPPPPPTGSALHDAQCPPSAPYEGSDRRSNSIASLRLKAHEHSVAMGMFGAYGKWTVLPWKYVVLMGNEQCCHGNMWCLWEMSSVAMEICGTYGKWAVLPWKYEHCCHWIMVLMGNEQYCYWSIYGKWTFSHGTWLCGQKTHVALHVVSNMQIYISI